MKHFKTFAIAFLVSAAGVALAATFNQFSPATGILKGSASTYVTTAASSSDVLGVIGTVPVANGGTNLTASADDNVMVGNGTTWETKSVSNCPDTGGNHLNYTASTNSFSCGTSGSGTSAGGSNTQIQYNSSGSFAGNAGFTYTSASNTVTLGVSGTLGTLTAPTVAATGLTLTIKGGQASGAGNAGGPLNLTGGLPADGVGGDINIVANDGVGTNRAGGALTLRSGESTGNANAGALQIIGGGASSGTGNAGQIDIIGGTGGNGGTGALIQITGGSGNATAGNAGSVSIRGGAPVAGNGGSVSITGRDGNGTNKNGGDVTLTAGAPTGSGTRGLIKAASAFVSTGTKFTTSGCSVSATTGGVQAGTYTSGTTGTCTVTITLPTSTNGWACHASDLNTPANLQSQSASTTTSCTITGTTVSGDVVAFGAIGF